MKLHRPAAIALVIAVAAGIATAEKTIDQLVDQLKTGNYQTQTEARQMLPTKGPAAVPPLLPLLAEENQVIWRTSFNVIKDIANEVSAPGRDDGRRFVADQLLSALAKTESAETKRRLMRLLPWVVAQGDDIAPISGLLDNAGLREKARRCLESIGTTEARAALRDELREADDAFRCALLHSLGRLHDRQVIASATKLADHENPEVRVAAAYALAPFGRTEMLRRVVDHADHATRSEAISLWMQAAECVKDQPDLSVPREVLDMTDDVALRGAAITRLLKYGTPDDVGLVLKRVAAAPDGLLEPALIEGVRQVGDDKVLLTVATQAYPKFVSHMQISLLDALGRPGADELVSFMNRQLASDDAEIRRAALEALANIATSGALEEIKAYAVAAPEEERDAAIAELKQLATKLGLQHDPNAAKAYLAIYRIAPDIETKRYALQGLLRHPSSAAWDAATDAMDTPALAELGTSILVWCVHHWPDSTDRHEQMLQRLEFLAAHATTTGLVDQVLQLARQLPGGKAIAPKLGFITEWQLAGPFAWEPGSGFKSNPVGAPDVDLEATYTVGDRKVEWRTVETPDAGGIVDVASVVGKRDHAMIFARAEIEMPRDTDAVLRIGSDDGVKAWVNGKVVHENDAARACQLDQDQAPVHLNKGKNTVIVQITQDIFGWSFCVRLTKPDGTPIRIKR